MPTNLTPSVTRSTVEVPEGTDFVERVDLVAAYQALLNRGAWLESKLGWPDETIGLITAPTKTFWLPPTPRHADVIDGTVTLAIDALVNPAGFSAVMTPDSILDIPLSHLAPPGCGLFQVALRGRFVDAGSADDTLVVKRRVYDPVVASSAFEKTLMTVDQTVTSNEFDDTEAVYTHTGPWPTFPWSDGDFVFSADRGVTSLRIEAPVGNSHNVVIYGVRVKLALV